MKALHTFIALATLSLSTPAMAQKTLTEDATKAQKELVQYLRSINITSTIDTRDNSVLFKNDGTIYWVTFDGSAPVLYTIHRKGLKFDKDASFKEAVARFACNEVNLKHKIKCTYKDKHIDFISQAYAKNPADFHTALRKMLSAFKDVETTYKTNYEKQFNIIKKDSIEKNSPIISSSPVGESPLKVTYIGFANFDAQGQMISDYDKALRKSAVKYIKASLDVESKEKGLFKIGMKIFNPEGKAMVAAKGVEYSSTANIEISKTDKVQVCELGAYGSDEADFWKAGEYKVEIYDFEKGALLETTSFNIL